MGTVTDFSCPVSGTLGFLQRGICWSTIFDLVIVINIDMNDRKVLLYFKVGQSVCKFSMKIWHVEEMTLLLKVKLSSNTNFGKRFNFRLCIWIMRCNYDIMYGNYEMSCQQVKNNVVGQHRYVQIARWYISYFFRDRYIVISQLKSNFEILVISKLVIQPAAEKYYDLPLHQSIIVLFRMSKEYHYICMILCVV